jgi:hypothetical protein
VSYEGEKETAYEGDTASDVDSRGQIERALDELDDAILHLARIVEEAPLRLGPALRHEETRPQPGLDGAAKLAVVGGSSPLRDRLLGARSRVRTLVSSLGETLERVDL